MAAERDGRQARALAHVERAHALGGVELVAAHAVEVDAQRLHVHRDLAQRLHAIHVQRHAGLARRCARFRRWAARFPVSLLACMMETSTVSGRSARRTSSGSTTPSAPTGRRVTATPSRSSCAQGQHGGMLDGAGDHVAGRAGRRAHHAQHRQVIGFGAAAGEDDFGGRAWISAAICRRAASRRCLAACPKWWMLEALPYT